MSETEGSKKAIMDSTITDYKTVDSKGSPSTIEEPVVIKKSKTTSYFNILFSGFALLSDGYQSGIISFVNLFLGKIYGPDVFNATMKSRLSYSMFVGAIVGQIGILNMFISLSLFIKHPSSNVGFGLIIDRVGRKIGLIATTFLVILGAALSAASSGKTATGLLWMMIIARGVIGVGVGGEYPCSSVSAGESADEVAPGKRGGLFVLVKY